MSALDKTQHQIHMLCGAHRSHFVSDQLHWDGHSVTMEALPPPSPTAPPPPPAVDWQAKYEALVTSLQTVLKAV